MPNLVPISESPVITLVKTMAAANWRPPVASLSTPGISAACWDNFNHRWIYAADIFLGGTEYFENHDGGTVWQQVTEGTYVHFAGSTLGMAASSQTGAVAVQMIFSVIGMFDPFGTTITYNISPAQPTVAAVDNFYLTNLFLGTYAFQLYGANYTGSSYTGYWYQLPDNLSGSPTINSNTVGLPAAFASGSGNPGPILVANNVPAQYNPASANAAQGGVYEVVVFGGATPGSDTPHLMQVFTSGLTIDLHINLTLALPGSTPYVITGLAYSQTDRLWGLLLGTSSNGTFLYTSPDLATWTQAYHFTHSNYNQMNGLACIGSVWATYVLNSNYYGSPSENDYRILYSPNVASGSASWSTAGLRLTSDGTVPIILQSNGSQFMAASRTTTSSSYVALSNKVGITIPNGTY